MIIKERITEVRKHIGNGKLQVDEFSDRLNKPDEAINNLIFAEYELESALLQLNKISASYQENMTNFITTENTGGLIDFIGDNWLYIRINTLLPNTRSNIGVKYVTNTVTKLLDHHHEHYGGLPQYDRAFLAIIEHHKPSKASCSFDHDNKGFKAIPNALKGRVFLDDNQFQLSLGLFSVLENDDEFCEIYVVPMSDIVSFSQNYLYFL